MYQLILIFHILAALLLVGLILIQHGKGADIGASFGSGASTTVFGSQGTGTFLFKLTGSLALFFFLTSLLLSYFIATQYTQRKTQFIPQQTTVPQKTTIPLPAAPAKAPSLPKESK